MGDDIENLRIHFYGVQGSSSVFPDRDVRAAAREVLEIRLLERVIADLATWTDDDGRLACRLQDVIGGPLDRDTLRAYRERFHLEEPPVYGGWTTCVHIETSDGHDIVLDCGSGFRICAKHLQEKWGDREDRTLHVFGSHSHYDHTEGFDQAVVCFDPRNEIRVHGNRQYLQALDQNLGVFSRAVHADLRGVHTPLHYELMPARFSSCEILSLDREPGRDGRPDALAHATHDVDTPLSIGRTTIEAFEVFHPAPCLAYRIEHGGKVFVFCTDHELRHGPDPDDPRQVASLDAERRLRERAMGADVLYRDGQFLRAEYDGQMGIGSAAGMPRIDWGHSCIEDVMEMAEACRIRSTYIGHHDPNRDWTERNWMDQTLRRKSDQTRLAFELARAETIIDL